jgi:hypothetical protein
MVLQEVERKDMDSILVIKITVIGVTVEIVKLEFAF